MTAGIRNPHLPTGCCVPFVRPWPSGRQWTHSSRCEFNPNQKFSTEEARELHRHNTGHVKERHIAKNAPRAAIHPACKAAWAEGLEPCAFCAPRLHDATCRCAACSYAEAHMDDEDDVEVSHG